MEDDLVKIDNPSSLLPIVEHRLPTSCLIYNQLKLYPRFKDEIEIYFLGSGREERDTWIFTRYLRDDYNVYASVSPPSQLQQADLERVKRIVGSNQLVNWNEKFIYFEWEPTIAKLILELQADVFTRPLTVVPTCTFHMAPEAAVKLDVKVPENSKIRMGPLNLEQGVPFIADNWPFTVGEKSHSAVRKCISHLISVGLYVTEDGDKDEKLVCGAVLNGMGMLSMLFTDPDYRRKGYATLCQQYLLREMGREGLQPCLVAELGIQSSIDFHSSLGLKCIARNLYLRNWRC